jgi:tRNA G26 N,N-dimethylase Trm1
MALVGLRVTIAEGQMLWVVKVQEKAEVKSESQVEAEAEQGVELSMVEGPPWMGLLQNPEVKAEAEQEVVLLMVEGPLEEVVSR